MYVTVKKSKSKEPSKPKPKPGRQSLTGAPFITAVADHKREKESINPSVSAEKRKSQKKQNKKSKKISLGTQVLTNTKNHSTNCNGTKTSPIIKRGKP